MTKIPLKERFRVLIKKPFKPWRLEASNFQGRSSASSTKKKTIQKHVEESNSRMSSAGPMAYDSKPPFHHHRILRRRFYQRLRTISFSAPNGAPIQSRAPNESIEIINGFTQVRCYAIGNFESSVGFSTGGSSAVGFSAGSSSASTSQSLFSNSFTVGSAQASSTENNGVVTSTQTMHVQFGSSSTALSFGLVGNPGFSSNSSPFGSSISAAKPFSSALSFGLNSATSLS
ncbi:hypothetical protein QYF36_017799 [Acer negundo]|nr:hypothetical protein QYF36_017799 [Acer negundo]